MDSILPFSEEKIVNIAEVNQQHCSEESGQWLKNVDQTYLVLASDKLVLQKVHMIYVQKLSINKYPLVPDRLLLNGKVTFGQNSNLPFRSDVLSSHWHLSAATSSRRCQSRSNSIS